MAAYCCGRTDNLDVSNGCLKIFCGGDDTSRNYTAADTVFTFFAIIVTTGISITIVIAITITIAITYIFNFIIAITFTITFNLVVAINIHIACLQNQRTSDGCRSVSGRRQSQA